MPDTEGCLMRLMGLFGVAALFVALAAALVIPVHAQQTDRAKRLGQKLFCVCGCTQVLTACNHVGCTYSTAMLKEARRTASRRGDSDDLILQSFVQEYGLKVLTEPPNKGFNRFAVIAPIVAPIVALFILWEVVRRWRQRAALAGAGRAADFARASGPRAQRIGQGVPMSSADILVACMLLAAATLIFVFNIRSDASDFQTHRTELDRLIDRREAIYENLRDLRFEYRAGKFSEKDYEETKQLLEIEAARVLADMDRLTGATPTPATRQAAAEKGSPLMNSRDARR